MSFEATFIFWIICFHIMPTGSSIYFTHECHSGTISNLLGPMVRNIAERYFINSQCVCVITEENADVLKYIPKTILISHIQIGGIGSTIKEIEDSEILDSTKLTNETQMFERLLIETMNAGCESYLVQVRNMRSVIHSFARTTRRAVTRFTKRFLYLPVTLEGEIPYLENVFSMKEMNYMPDLIIARYVNAKKRSDLIQHRYENMNSKGKHYKSNMMMNSTTDITMKFIRDRHKKDEPQMPSNNTIMEIRRETSNCIIEWDRCMEGPEDTNKLTNRSINLCHASGLNRVPHGVSVIELVTLKFVGKNPSSEVVLDVWITDCQNLGFLTCTDLFPYKTGNLEGREVKATTFNLVPFNVITHNEETPVYDGIELLAFIECAEKLNFTWKLVLDEDNFWGAVWSNGSGNGVIGMVAEDQVDVGFAGLYYWHSTFLWTDYTTALSTSGITCMVPKPKMLPSWMSLWLPFSAVMWAAVSVSILIITMVFYMLAKASNRYLGAAVLESYATWINCFLTTMGMFVLQSPPDPQAASHRPIKGFVTSLLIFFLLVSSVYSGGLASILTVPRYEHPIDTVKELADSNLPWVNIHEAWVWSLLDSDDPVSKTLVRHFQVLTEEEMTVLSTQGKTAFSLEKLASNHYCVPVHINETAIQTLRIMKETMYGSHITIATRKSSPYKERFNQIISSLYETGIMLFWEGQTTRRYISQRLQIAIMQSVVLNNQEGPTQLMVDHLQGAFVILSLGLALATVVFIGEMACSIIKRYHESFKDKFG